ncbi:unnamed protein product, partial [Iphiclides podalirius]
MRSSASGSRSGAVRGRRPLICAPRRQRPGGAGRLRTCAVPNRGARAGQWGAARGGGTCASAPGRRAASQCNMPSYSAAPAQPLRRRSNFLRNSRG